MNAQQKDKNEPFIIAIYRGLGLWAQQCDRSMGFDVIIHGTLVTKDVICAGPWIAENKSSEYKARPQQLTDNERKTKAKIEEVGGSYPINISGYDALKVIGITLDDLELRHLLEIANELTNLKDIDDDIKPMVDEFQTDVFDRIEKETFG